MVNGDDWKDKLVEGNKYRVVTRYEDADAVFIGIGAVGSERQDPVFSFNEVTMMLPWQGIDRIELVE